MKAAFPFYHSSKELHQRAESLVQGCAGAATMNTHNDSGVSISLVHVRGRDAKPKNRVFLLCGEHSRELIGPESCLHLLKRLCGEDGDQDALKDSEFQMIINANPRSRAKVEAGEFCLRENPAGVDLNRNWDEHFEAQESMMSDTHPGPTAFSEPETKIFRKVVSKFKPTTFLSIHSGTLGMYMPWAYDKKHLAKRNQQSMMQVLRQLDQGHCHCPYGAAGKEVGYNCPGTSMDYVYDKMQTPYSFAFEIWAGKDELPSLRRRWQSKVDSSSSAVSLLQEGERNLAHKDFADFFREHSSDFVHLGIQNHADSKKSTACFRDYNPDTEEDYDKVVENWVNVYLETAQLIADELSDKAANHVQSII